MKKNKSLRLRSPIIPGLLGIFLVMQLIDPSRVWIVMLVSLGGAWLIASLWARSLTNELSLQREMRFGWAQVGDRLEERFILTNKGWAAGDWVEISDESTLPGHHTNLVTGVDGHTSTEWRTQSVCTRRGLYTLGPTTLKTSDPFGIYEVTLHDPASRLVMVMPPVVSLPAIKVAPGGRSGDGHPRANAPEKTVSASSVRAYVAGDSLRHVHWPSSARHNELFVRVFDGTPTGDWRILLDLDQAFQVGEGQNSTEEHGVILAASLATHGLKLHRSVGLTVNSKELVWMPSRPGENHKWEVLRSLALVHPGPTHLGEVLNRMSPELHAHTSLILITADKRGDWLSHLLPLVWRGIVPTILLLDPDTFRPADKAADDSAASASPAGASVQLTQYGIRHYLISRELLDRPEARPGQKGQIEWRVTPTGRAILADSGKEMDWEALA